MKKALIWSVYRVRNFARKVFNVLMKKLKIKYAILPKYKDRKILDNKWSIPIRHLEETLVSSLPMLSNAKSPDFHPQQAAISCQRRLGGQSGLHHHPVMESTNKNKLIEKISLLLKNCGVILCDSTIQRSLPHSIHFI